MKKLYTVLVMSVLLASCGVTPEDNARLEQENQELVAKQAQLTAQTAKMSDVKNAMGSDVQTARDILKKVSGQVAQLDKTRRALEAGKTPRYILKIKLKQSRMSLDIMKHAKDAINAIEFELPVDEEFYNSVTVGHKILKDFRSGSFIMNGTWSSWKMTVENKRIIYD